MSSGVPTSWRWISLLGALSCARQAATTDGSTDVDPMVDAVMVSDIAKDKPGDELDAIEVMLDANKTLDAGPEDLIDGDAEDAEDDLVSTSADVSMSDDTADSAIPPSDSFYGECIPLLTRPCECVPGLRGASRCNVPVIGDPPRWEGCRCTGPLDAGVTPEAVAARVLPPRLILPQSASRVTSQRPTMRWVLPAGVTRARVELCNDRLCTRPLTSAEVSGSSWRPESALRPGVVFWRVRGLDVDGGVAWTSATWEFFVGRRNAANDTSCGGPKDFNGDGYDDLPQQHESDSFDIRNGSALGPDRSISVRFPYENYPGTANSILATGDYDGDGYTDMAIPFMHERPPADNLYMIRILHGGPTGLGARHTDPTYPSYVSGRFQNSSDMCDVDGDGSQDLISYSFPHGMELPAATYYYGITFTVTSGSLGRERDIPDAVAAPFYNSGYGEFRCMGDVNLDGYADVLYRSTPSVGHGKYIIYFGSPNGMHNAMFYQLLQPDHPEAHSFGDGPFAALGDFNGDGQADVGTTSTTAAFSEHFERVLITLGASTFRRDGFDLLLSTDLPTPFVDPHVPPEYTYRSWEISSVIANADFNGDGYCDVATSSPCMYPYGPSIYDRCNNGQVSLFWGSDSRASRSTDQTLNGSARNERFSASVSVGDYDGDGFSDLYVENDPDPPSAMRETYFRGQSSGISRTGVEYR